MSERYDFEPSASSAALQSWAQLRDGRAVVLGRELAQGLMGPLVSAELLAAKAGVVPYVDLPDGTRGVVQIGAARSRLDGAPESVRTLYLAAHGLARRTDATARLVPDATPLTVATVPSHRIAAGFVLPLLVLGVAAIVAGAAYATLTAQTRAEVDAENLRQAERLKVALVAAQFALENKRDIPPEFWQSLSGHAQAEHRAGGVLGALGSIAAPASWILPVGVVLVGGVLLWDHLRGSRGR